MTPGFSGLRQPVDSERREGEAIQESVLCGAAWRASRPALLFTLRLLSRCRFCRGAIGYRIIGREKSFQVRNEVERNMDTRLLGVATPAIAFLLLTACSEAPKPEAKPETKAETAP